MEKTVNITITLPDGYTGAEYDEETHMVNFIKEEYPVLSFKDAVKKLDGKYVFFLDTYSEMIKTRIDIDSIKFEKFEYYEDEDIIYSYDEAIAFKALMKLRLIWHVCVGDWMPDVDQMIYYISRYDLSVKIGTKRYCKEPFIFPTEESAKKFVNTHKELLDKIKMFFG